MPLQQIREDVLAQTVTFGPHLIERMFQNGISIEQVLDTILTGTMTKKERDERSGGKFTKYTLRKGWLSVTVKDCRPAFILTANRK